MISASRAVVVVAPTRRDAAQSGLASAREWFPDLQVRGVRSVVPLAEEGLPWASGEQWKVTLRVLEPDPTYFDG